MAPIPFPIKLWNVVESLDGLVTWSSDGRKIIVDENSFDALVIRYHPTFLRSPTLFSLRRSLRWYNFICSGRSKRRDGIIFYWHPYFRRDRKELLSQVTPGNKRVLVKQWATKFKKIFDELRDRELKTSPEIHPAAWTCRPSKSTVQGFELNDENLDPDLFDYADVDDICSLVWNGIQQQPKPIDNPELPEADAASSDNLSNETTLYQTFCNTTSAAVLSKDGNINNSQNLDTYYPNVQLQLVNACDWVGKDGVNGEEFVNPFNCGMTSYQPEAYTEDISLSLLNSCEDINFLYLSFQEPIGLNSVPEALKVDDTVCDTWLEGETRTYFAL